MKKKIIIVVGTRSEVIKFSSIIRELRKNKDFDVKILHTGQHDTIKLMKSLNLPNPDFYLGESLRKKWSRKSKLFSIILAIFWVIKTFFKIRKILIQEKPDAVFYQGNCMSVPITVFAAKSISRKIILIHRESGMRSGNIFEPFLGDFAYKIGDRFGDILFVQNKIYKDILKKEGIKADAFNVGDPHVEIIDYVLKNLKPKKKIEIKNYVVVNVIHFENITKKWKMENLIKILIKCPMNVIFLINESIKSKLEMFGLMPKLKKYSHIILSDMFDFVDFINLIKNSQAVITDSGGVQQECFILKIPCIFIGNRNMWKEFEKFGVVKTTKFDVKKTINLLNEIKNKGKFYKNVKESKYPLGDGKATKRIVNILEKKLRV